MVSTISAEMRPKMTKGLTHRNRIAGKIPAVIYGGGNPATEIFVDEKSFLKLVHTISESSILDIDIAGKSIKAFVKSNQRDTLSNKIIHIDFLEVVEGRIIHAKVPLHVTGIPKGVREGGVLETPAHEIEVECIPSRLPLRIEVEVSHLEANHSIHVRDLKIDPDVKIISSLDLVVAAVKFAKAEAAPAAAAATAAAPVAGAAATPEQAASTDKADKTEKKEDKK